jgi:hypothetical protein
VHHRTSTVHCPVRISFLNWRSRPLKIYSRWRTGHCPVSPSDRWLGHASRADCAADRWLTGQSGAPPDSPVNFSRSLLTVFRERRLRRRRLTGQSGAPPDSPVIYSRTPPSRPESRLFIGTGPSTPDTVRCTTGQSGAPRLSSLLAVHSQLFSKTISPVSST